MTDTQDDQTLVARIKQGDRGAFRLLFERYERPILNFAFRYLGRHEEAEEVVQETFMRVFRHAGRFDGARPFKPWLYQIAVNAMRTHGGRRARQAVSDAGLAAATDRSQQPIATVAATEDAAAVAAAIAELPTEQRMVFILANYQGLDYPAVAQILGIPLGTVKSRMYRAIRLLRGRLEGLLP